MQIRETVEPQVLVDRYNALSALISTYSTTHETDIRNGNRLKMASQKIVDELTEQHVQFYIREGKMSTIILGYQPPSIDEQREQLRALNREMLFATSPLSGAGTVRTAEKKIREAKKWFDSRGIFLYQYNKSYTISNPVETQRTILRDDLALLTKELTTRLTRIKELAESALEDLQHPEKVLNPEGVFQNEPIRADHLITECAALRRMIHTLEQIDV